MTTKNPLVLTNEAGQSLWLDFIQRSILENGELLSLINDDKITGLTSNPAIFKQAIAGTAEYDKDISAAASNTPEASDMDIYNGLAIADIQAAADLFAPVFNAGNGEDGMVSIEVSPTLANDTKATISEGLELHRRVDRPNVMIKVPGTKAGIRAFEELTANGINVNVTLLFSVERYKDIAQAYLRGLGKRMEAGESIKGITSVASFFISRVDAAVDSALSEIGNSELPGKIAIANAKVAYDYYENLFHNQQFEAFAAAGALPQRLLWASTGTKNPEYRDVMYLEQLIGPETVNTVPPATLDAFRDHGVVAQTLKADLESAQQQLKDLSALGIDLDAITDKLEADGVASFVAAFDELLTSVASKRASLSNA